VRGHYWGIFRRAASSWVQLGGSGLIADQGAVTAYNAKDGCVYMGGGTGSGADQFRRINADGTITSRSLPSGWTLATWDASSPSTTAMLLGGTATAKMIAISKGLQIREYDDTTDTWSSVIANVPAAVDTGVTPGASWIACTVQELSCVVFFKLASLSATHTTGHIWKR
jgi:hypothetical protein